MRENNHIYIDWNKKISKYFISIKIGKNIRISKREDHLSKKQFVYTWFFNVIIWLLFILFVIGLTLSIDALFNTSIISWYSNFIINMFRLL